MQRKLPVTNLSRIVNTMSLFNTVKNVSMREPQSKKFKIDISLGKFSFMKI